jgi:hypothetical protein
MTPSEDPACSHNNNVNEKTSGRLEAGNPTTRGTCIGIGSEDTQKPVVQEDKTWGYQLGKGRIFVGAWADDCQSYEQMATPCRLFAA